MFAQDWIWAGDPAGQPAARRRHQLRLGCTSAPVNQDDIHCKHHQKFVPTITATVDSEGFK